MTLSLGLNLLTILHINGYESSIVSDLCSFTDLHSNAWKQDKYTMNPGTNKSNRDKEFCRKTRIWSLT